MADRRKDSETKRRLPRAVEVCLLLALIAAATCALHFGYRHYLRTAYPLGYSGYVETYAERYGFAPSLIYAIIRTESGFDPGAKSKAEAMGLMQLTGPTFEWAQRREPLGDTPAAEGLYDPETNIHYGVLVLSLLRESFPAEDTMLAAYNAGIGNVGKWLKDEDHSADGKTLHDIPFPETREYVRKVNAAQQMYRELYPQLAK